MSTSAPAENVHAAADTTASSRGSSLHDLRRRRILRYSLGVTFSAAVAFGFRWPLFFLAPMLVAVFLAHSAHSAPIRHARRLFVSILVAFALGLVFTYVLLPYPLVYVTLLALALFHIYYWGNSGGTHTLAAVLLLAVTLLPMASIDHHTRASGLILTLSYAGSAALAVVTYLIAHLMIPDPGRPAKAPVTALAIDDSNAAAVTALKSTLVVLPITIVFLSMNWASELLVIVFAAIFSLSPQVTESRAAGTKMVIANLIGAAAALVFYWLIVAVPEYHFFLVLMFLSTLVFGNEIFSEGSLAKYMNPACIALLVLIGGSMTEHAEFIDKPIIRVVLIGLAALYAAAATALVDRMFYRLERIYIPKPTTF